MAQLDWDLGGGGSSFGGGGDSGGSDDVDEIQNPEAGLTGEEGSTDTGSITIGTNSDGWDAIEYGDDSDSGMNDSGVDEVRNPGEQLRYESGLDEDSTGTGSTIVTSGGAPDAGAVTIDPTRDSTDATEDNEDFMETVGRVTTAVTRERNQDNRDDNDILTGSGGGSDGGESPLDFTVTTDDGSVSPAVLVGAGLLGLALISRGGG